MAGLIMLVLAVSISVAAKGSSGNTSTYYTPEGYALFSCTRPGVNQTDMFSATCPGPSYGSDYPMQGNPNGCGEINCGPPRSYCSCYNDYTGRAMCFDFWAPWGPKCNTTADCPCGYRCSNPVNCGGKSCVSTARCNAQYANCDLSSVQKEWIKLNEGFAATPTGGAIGYGHDCNAHKDCDQIPQPMTTDTASALFEQDWPKFAKFVHKNLENTDYLTTNQFAALVDFAFNTGGHDPKYLNQFFFEDLRTYKMDVICETLKTAFTFPDLHIRVNGTWKPRRGGPSQGKRNRRQKEADMCATPTEFYSGCYNGIGWPNRYAPHP